MNAEERREARLRSSRESHREARRREGHELEMFLDRLPSRHRYLAHFPGTGLRHQRAFLAGSSYIDELVRNSRQASEEAKEKDREIQELRERVATLEHELNENRRLRARVETLEQALSWAGLDSARGA